MGQGFLPDSFPGRDFHPVRKRPVPFFYGQGEA